MIIVLACQVNILTIWLIYCDVWKISWKHIHMPIKLLYILSWYVEVARYITMSNSVNFNIASGFNQWESPSKWRLLIKGTANQKLTQLRVHFYIKLPHTRHEKLCLRGCVILLNVELELLHNVSKLTHIL